MAYDLTDLVTVEQLRAAMLKTRTVYDSKISAVFTPKGTIAFAALTAALLIESNLGNVYNVSDAFTTTSDFIEGTGKKHSAGSNVAIVEATAATYKETADTTAQSGKTYYSDNTGTIAFPVPTAGETLSGTYYEVDSPATYKFDVMPGDLSNLQELAVPSAAGNIALLNANGQVIDSTIAVATNVEVNEMLNEVYA